MKKNVVSFLLCGMLAISSISLAGCGAAAPAAPTEAETATEEKAEDKEADVEEKDVEADAADDEMCSDETFADLQDLYGKLVEAYDATVEAYNDDSVAADPEIEDALEEAKALIEELGEVKQEDIAEDEALDYVDAMLAINDIFAASLDQMELVADDIDDISSAIAGTVWVDDDLNVYGFGEDGSTLTLAIMDEDGEYLEDVTGTYGLFATDDNLIGLSLSVADVEVNAVLTDYSDEALEFTDIETGESAVFVPFVE